MADDRSDADRAIRELAHQPNRTTCGLQRTALVRSLHPRIAALDLGSLRVLDRLATRLEQLRAVHGDLELDVVHGRLAARFGHEAVDGLLYAISEQLAVEDQDHAELREAARAELLTQPGAGEAIREYRERVRQSVRLGAAPIVRLPRRPICNGLTARWCPRCGDCSCGEGEAVELNDPGCPLHAPGSKHAEPPDEIGGVVGAYEELTVELGGEG
ncbi:MAG: hypothetical protein ABR520_11125 [Mycobacteriales bacterium]|nr:hypothetical protein [Actinomycetota bacterium]